MGLVDDQDEASSALGLGAGQSLGGLGQELEAMEVGVAAQGGDERGEQADGASGWVGELCG
jgi:hypothetical protein